MLIEDCKADGFDAKDFGTVSADNVLARVTVRNVGNGGGHILADKLASTRVAGGRSKIAPSILMTSSKGSAPDFAPNTPLTMRRVQILRILSGVALSEMPKITLEL